MALRAEIEPHVEVYEYRWYGVGSATFLALVLQTILPKYFSQATLLELPLLVTLYFALSRRNPATGLLLGMTIGLLQDSVSGPQIPLGYYGIAKTLVGFGGSSLGGRLDTEHPLARVLLALAFYFLHHGVIVLIGRLLMNVPVEMFSGRVLLAALLNAGLTVVLYPLLDRLRKTA